MGQPADPEAVSWRSLRLGGRVRVVFVVTFVVFHAACVLVTGLPKEHREKVWARIAWYADGLRMTNRWGMFSRPPRVASVLVIAEHRGGREQVLSTSIQTERSWWRRIVDVRLRKIQGNLTKDDHRRHHGHAFLEYWCRYARATAPGVWRVKLRVDTPTTYEDSGAVREEASKKVLLVRRCGAVGPVVSSRVAPR